jgi:predicted MPP superfamily phosphohydrolase
MEHTLAIIACAALIAISQLHGYLFIPSRLRSPLGIRLVKAAYLAFNLSGFAGFILIHALGRGLPDGPLSDYLLMPGMVWQTAHLLWLPPALLIQALMAVFSLVFRGREQRGLPRLFRYRRPLSSPLNPVSLLLAFFLALSFHSYFLGLNGPALSRVTLSYPGLPPELEGASIALVSDVHYGSGLNLGGFDRLMRRVAAESPSLVLFLGDLSDCAPARARDLVGPLLRLKGTPLGVYAVLGDRDRRANASGELLRALGAGGVTALDNERVRLPGAPVTLIGFSDPEDGDNPFWPLDFIGAEAPLPFQLLDGPSPAEGDFTAVLSHRPGLIPPGAAEGARLFLAGHTRGGQFQLPLLPGANLAAPFYTYSSGLYRSGGANVLVSRGVADSFFHLRLFAPPEVNLVTLRGLPAAPPGPPPPPAP